MNVKTVTKKKEEWQLQEAKAMFSEVIKAATVKPQIITVRGKETAVILSIGEYKKLARPRQTLFEFIKNSPLYGLELELPSRQPEEMREVLL
jgi:prevent-host-death family protein